MSLTATPTTLPEVLILRPRLFGDERGFFFESFNAREFERATGLRRTFVQDNHSRSVHGVLRGLHYQLERPQGKLVRVVHGEIFDVAVDLRRESPTFGKWAGAILSAERNEQLWVPEGFAHGFVVLSDSADVLYKATEFWYPEFDRSLAWNDPDIGIEWPARMRSPILARKDAEAPRFDAAPVYEGLLTG